MIYCSKERMEEKINTFARFGDTGRGGITRLSLSPVALEARQELLNRCENLGMDIKMDDMANIYATLKGEEGLPAILMGSHLDSVVKGGNYDGILGVLTALEVIETIVIEKIKHRHPITMVVWTNEEGARFDPAMMSSGVVCQKFDKEKMLKSMDTDGISFEEALEKSGYKGSVANRMKPKESLAFLELHIEQGPVLEAQKKDIGIVEGVCGMVNYEISCYGQADHAGTTPMKYRRDALYAATKVIQYLHDELDCLDDKLVYTTGRILAFPNIHTIIPDEVRFTLDARHQDAKVIEQVVEIINRVPKEVVGCQVIYQELWSRKTVIFHKPYVDFVEKNAKKCGYSSMRMYSGPGHDAQFVSDIVPTTMIFVPSVKGHSHCEKEFTPMENCWKGANIMLKTALDIDLL